MPTSAFVGCNLPSLAHCIYQGLNINCSLIFLAVVEILARRAWGRGAAVQAPSPLHSIPKLISGARRRRQHILIRMTTPPLRRRWSITITDGRRWDQSTPQFLQRAPARLRQNESASHGLAWTFSCNGRVAYHMRVTQTFEDSQTMFTTARHAQYPSYRLELCLSPPAYDGTAGNVHKR